MNAESEKVQCDLDQLMEHQAKQDLLHNAYLKNEIETIQNKHDLQIEKQTNIINDQSRSISELSIKIELLMKENKRLKQIRHYSCEECHFDSEIREQLLKHKYNEHQENESESEEEESTFYQCDLCPYKSGWPDNVHI